MYILFGNSYTFHNFSLNLPPSKKNFALRANFCCNFYKCLTFLGKKKIFRSEVGRSEGGKVGRSEGRKVGRLDVGKIGRFEGGKARKNLMEAYTFHNSFLIPSTQKFFIGDLRSPIFHKIYSPGSHLQPFP